MKYPAAVKIAIQAMQKEKKAYVFDANLYEKFGVRTPSAENAYKQVSELDEAIAALKGQPALNLKM
jgi:hypothetical protein